MPGGLLREKFRIYLKGEDMDMTDELTILKEITTVLKRDFMAKAKEVAERSRNNISFNVADFVNISLNDYIAEHEEFGIVMVQSSGYQSDNTLGRDAINEINYEIQVITLDKGDTATEISIIRMAIAELLLREDLDFLSSCSLVIESTEPFPLEFGPKEARIKHVLSGVTVKVSLGI